MEHNLAKRSVVSHILIKSDARNVHERTVMSVTVIARFNVADVDKAVAWAQANPSITDEITTYGKSLGQLGHRMLSADGDLVVIDEWPTAEAFTTFFANAPRMADFLAGAGIQGEPAISMLDSIDDIPGTF
jgi:hypothetical protein